MASLLARQALWVPVVKHNPTFVEQVHKFLQISPITSLTAAAIGLKLEEVRVALEPDARHTDKMVASMMAFPVQISGAACDSVLEQQQRRELSFGFATSMCDSCNTIHLIERLLPASHSHVSVSIQSNCMRNLREGEKLLVVSTIDKMGKRLVYCKTDFFVEVTEPVPEEVVQRERNIKTLAELRVALMHYEKAVSGAHVKLIIAERKLS
ncbi:conserved hypothetical protein [Leishmania braziliensis MHOM/BR/75/M2904]|uniref:Thioesterase domain-containing protein n=2 Tax=Leishmania braziliensis TaxID=5660 RepID=A4HBP7_LEIBR|nr:conserved hypothetical protein [Leishmania braziliensis MHOM/BR/75/M2904]KAI5690467.1 hypothetical protein MNV84_03555 [Leishmania braziliensis]CAJ2472411.1 unnamed protein product [Leishmania braziliensis]CAJ2472883.1 unnamed protein product [Leishmania braziliensis]CAM38836.1 conserved hypothetical protein [Leishmania braziliensis MHOM/BR/75/M2904]SYZ65657.1 hypothetical_protein [Leishmania braziliensis MHOM/BR/75/M2904]